MYIYIYEHTIKHAKIGMASMLHKNWLSGFLDPSSIWWTQQEMLSWSGMASTNSVATCKGCWRLKDAVWNETGNEHLWLSVDLGIFGMFDVRNRESKLISLADPVRLFWVVTSRLPRVHFPAMGEGVNTLSSTSGTWVPFPLESFSTEPWKLWKTPVTC